MSTAKKHSRQCLLEGCFQLKKSQIACDKRKAVCHKYAKRNIAYAYELRFVFQDGSGSKKRASKRGLRSKGAGGGSNNNNNSSSSSNNNDKPQHSIIPSLPSSSATLHASADEITQHLVLDPPDLGLCDAVPTDDHQATKCTQDCNFPGLLLYDDMTNADFTIPEFLYASSINFPLFDPDEYSATASLNISYGGKPWHGFQAEWRKSECLISSTVLKDNDPIQEHFADSQSDQLLENVGFQNYIPFGFVWTMARCTYLFSNFPTFPDSKIETLMSMLWTINAQYSVIEYALRCNCALYLKNVYETGNNRRLFDLWSAVAESPDLQFSIVELTTRIQKTLDFTEYIAGAFAIFLLFAAKAALEGSEESDCKEFHKILSHGHQLKPNDIYLTDLESSSIFVLQFLEAWFSQTELMACFLSDNGGAFEDVSEISHFFDAEFLDFYTFNGKYDLIKGCMNGFNGIYRRLYSKMAEFKGRGVPLSGRHIIKHKLLNSDESLSQELLEFGQALMLELDFSGNNEFEFSGLYKIGDSALEYAMKNCNEMHSIGLKLYLKVFFINDSLPSLELLKLLEGLLYSCFQFSCYSNPSAFCHFYVYLGAVVSLFMGHVILFDQFKDLLQKFVNSGMSQARNSLERLRYISLVLEARNYALLINTEQGCGLY
ncbi:uncharacterized protein Ecym_4002 [Eremothecium cymbalariae DBVPG|uniref:Uncharacterized protein n=1 Tax=Eremothecium cymbalariae (strain CBS 270.75 / DBVPG 7215 / KCTC 17166 / NRRL Y-17582) TaxID=931890 RepID=G8JST3_ERECY|nr:hypothetical protein Ecym_4002 [Eremothecium cymbalariae DBVPG\